MWDGKDKELKKVNEDRTCFEENRRARMWLGENQGVPG